MAGYFRGYAVTVASGVLCEVSTFEYADEALARAFFEVCKGDSECIAAVLVDPTDATIDEYTRD